VSTLDSQGRAGESSKFKGINLFAFSDVTTLADTGDASINALLSGGTNQWWIDGSGASAAASAIQPAGWALAGSSSRHTLSYSFMSGSLPAGASGQDANGFVAMNSVQRTAVRQAFAYLSSLINVTFTESNAADGSADINFGMNTQASSAGYATPPHASGNHNVFVMLAANAPTNSSFDQGSYGWETLIHEIGHALGLKHPGNYNAGGGGASPPYLASALDNRRYSVMSYHQSADASVVTATQTGAGTSYSASGLNPSTYMREDIAALQFLYGAATGSDAQTAAAGFQTSTFGSDWQGFETLWAPGGASVDASASTRSTIVDLRAGAFSSINANPAPTAYLASFPKQVQAFVKTNNTFFGYNDVGLAYGSQITQADGGSGNDAFFDGGYSATIDGGGGTDVVYLSGTRTGWTAIGQAISGTAARDGSLTLSGSTTLTNIASGYTISLANIEKLKFYDASKAALTHGAVDLMA
jgi:serralysin